MFNTCQLLLLFPAVALTAKLYASHYGGTVSLLTLSGSGSSYSLTETSSIRACGPMPSWLTYDPANHMLYCSDEQFVSAGSLSAWRVGSNGELTQSTKVDAPSGGVANVLYGRTRFLAVAHYESSMISTFRLPITSSSTPQQTFKFTMAKPGPNPSRQDAPHPHHVVVDPTGNFLIVPDLGADMVRVYAIDQASGQLSACPSLNATAGYGPRHATFWGPGTPSRIRGQSSCTKLYVVNELVNSVTVYQVSYPTDGCPSFSEMQTINPYADNQAAPQGTKLAEIKIKGSYLYTTNRNDKKFSGNDSMTTFSISSTGSLTFQALSSSYGTYPRTFDINKAGDLVAIGDQATANVAVVKRDPATGRLGDLVANLRIGAAGVPEQDNGLSSVIFAD